MTGKLSNYEKKEFRRLFAASTDPFFKAFELLDTNATRQVPRVVLIFVLWEHLAWLLCGDSKAQIDATSKAFARFGEQFLRKIAKFDQMLAKTKLDLASLWAERNKQLHTGRMSLDPFDIAKSERRIIFYCDTVNPYREHIDNLAFSEKGKKRNAGLIYVDVFIESLREAANSLLEYLINDKTQGRVALRRLRLRGTNRVDVTVHRAWGQGFEKFKTFFHKHGPPAAFPLPNGGTRFVFGTSDAIVMSPAQRAALMEWLERNEGPGIL